MKHRERHPESVDGCFGCRILSIRLSGDATPTRSVEVADKNRREKQLSKDLDAFKTSVRQGVKPTHLTGAAEVLAKANKREDIP